MQRRLMQSAVVCLAAGTAALSLGCTQPVGSQEVIARSDEPLALSCNIGVIEEADVAASPDVIWQDLLVPSCYAHWNPWLTTAADTTHPQPGAEMEVGDNVTATVITATGSQSASETVTIVTAPGTPGQPAGQLAQLCWRDTIPITSALVPAYRCRTLTANADGTVHVKNDLELQGAIDWLAYVLESAALHKGMAAENQALAKLAESGTMDPTTCTIP
jgi:hypothetical protein